MPGADDGNETPHTPHTKGIIQHFERKVKLHTEGLDDDLKVTNDKLGQLEDTDCHKQQDYKDGGIYY